MAAAAEVAVAVTDGSPWLAPAPATPELGGEKLPMRGRGDGEYLVASRADTEGGRCC